MGKISKFEGRQSAGAAEVPVAANDNARVVEETKPDRYGLHLVEGGKAGAAPEKVEASTAEAKDAAPDANAESKGTIDYAPKFETVLKFGESKLDKAKTRVEALVGRIGKGIGRVIDRVRSFGKVAARAMENVFYGTLGAGITIIEKSANLSERMFVSAMERARQTAEQLAAEAKRAREFFEKKLAKAKADFRAKLKAYAERRKQNREDAAYRAEVTQWIKLEAARAKLNAKIAAHNARRAEGVPAVELVAATPTPEVKTSSAPVTEAAPKAEAPKAEAPKAEVPKAEAVPVAEAPQVEAAPVVTTEASATQAEAPKTERRFAGQDPNALVEQWATDAKSGAKMEDTVRAPEKAKPRFEGQDPNALVEQWAADAKSGRNLEDTVRAPQAEAPKVEAPVAATEGGKVLQGNFGGGEAASAANENKEELAA